MAPVQKRRFAPSPLNRGLPLLLLLGLALTLGLTGHDPWKTEDAIHFGVLWRGDLAGEWLPPPGHPPLHFWVARASGVLFGNMLGLPDAFRLASLLFTAAGCGLLYLAARELYGKEAASAAPLTLVGCLGFLVQSHETQPLLASLAALATVIAGAAALHHRRRYGTPLYATGLAALALSHGLALMPAAILLAATLPIFAERGTRGAVAVRTMLAIASALIAVLPWWLALHRGGGAALASYWTTEWLRFSGAADPARNALSYLSQIGWFAWPAWPLAIWGLWVRRHAWRTPAVWLGPAAFLLVWISLSFGRTASAANLLLLLPPLALLAAQGVPQLRRGAANAFDWFGRLTFGLLGFLLWFGWFAMQFRLPPKVSHNILRLSPGFEPSTEVPAVIAAIVLSGVWLWYVVREPRTPLRSIGHWTAGMALVWGLTMLLWLPWIDYVKSYRSVGAELATQLPPDQPCVEARGLGDAQTAAIEYAMGRQINPQLRDDCRFLIIQGGRDEFAPEREWRKLWEGSRPGDRHERLRLYRRDG